MSQAPDVALPSDTEQLVEFVEAVRQLLIEVLNRRELLEPYADEFRSSWPPNDARLKAVIEALSAEPGIRDLERHGLAGDELKLKLALFYDARADFRRALKRLRWNPLRWIFGHPMREEIAVDASGALVAVQERIAKPLTRSRQMLASARRLAGRHARTMLVKTLAVADTVLESVGAAVPEAAVAAAGAGEFKQLVEGVVGAARRWRRRKARVDTDVAEDTRHEPFRTGT